MQNSFLLRTYRNVYFVFLSYTFNVPKIPDTSKNVSKKDFSRKILQKFIISNLQSNLRHVKFLRKKTILRILVCN